MKVSDFRADELFSFRAEAELWGKKLTLYAEFSDEYDYHETLTSYIDDINDRLTRLEEGKEAVLAALIEDGAADKLGISAEIFSERLAPDEATVYCDDGRNNIWTELFLKVDGTALQVTLSPDNGFESKGVCS